MIYIINLFLLFGILYIGYRKQAGYIFSKLYWPAAIIKILAGVMVGIVYKYYYIGGDTYSFFESAIQVKEVAFSSWSGFLEIYLWNNYGALAGFTYTWIPSAIFVKILAPITLLTNDNYWFTGAYLSVFSFFGFWIWTNALYKITKEKWLAIIAGFLFPSLLFWTSGILKESLAIGSLAFLLTLFIKIYRGDRLKWATYLLCIALFILLALTKYFLAAILLATVISTLITRNLLKQEGPWYNEVLVLIVILLSLGGLISLLHPNLWPSRIAEVVYGNYEAYLNVSEVGNLVLFDTLEPSLASILLNMPKASFAGLFYPLLPIPGSPLSYLVVLENWLLLIGATLSLISFKLSENRQDRLLIWAGIMFVLISAGLIALSTPNLGTLSRYKTGYLIIFLPLVFSGIISSFRKLVQKAWLFL